MFEIGDELIPEWAVIGSRDVWDRKQNGPNGIYWQESKNCAHASSTQKNDGGQAANHTGVFCK